MEDIKEMKEEDLVEIEEEKVKKSGFGMFKDIGPFTEEDELDTEF